MKYFKHTLTVVPAGNIDEGLPVALARAESEAKEELSYQKIGTTFKFLSHSVFYRPGTATAWLSCVFQIKTK